MGLEVTQALFWGSAAITNVWWNPRGTSSSDSSYPTLAGYSQNPLGWRMKLSQILPWLIFLAPSKIRALLLLMSNFTIGLFFLFFPKVELEPYQKVWPSSYCLSARADPFGWGGYLSNRAWYPVHILSNSFWEIVESMQYWHNGSRLSPT